MSSSSNGAASFGPPSSSVLDSTLATASAHATIPRLPQLKPSIMLDTAQAIQFDSETFWDRFGKEVLFTAVVNTLLATTGTTGRHTVSAADEVLINKLLSDAQLAIWARETRLLHEYARTSDAIDESSVTEATSARLFRAFAGAVQVEHTSDILDPFIRQLIDLFIAAQPTAAPLEPEPTQNKPPISRTAMCMLNERLQLHHMNLVVARTASGPANHPTWTTTLEVQQGGNRVTAASGSGNTVARAKEAAAAQVCANQGWL